LEGEEGTKTGEGDRGKRRRREGEELTLPGFKTLDS